ncbi:MAG TPA: O-antigen ligase [Leptolyngbyaceae cyanobacterium]
MKKLLEFLETGFTVVSLMLYTGGPLTVIVKGGASEGEADFMPGDSPLIQLAFIVIYMVTFFLLAIRWRKTIYVLSHSKNIALLVGIAILSLLWSINPARTFSRVFALVGTTLFGIYLSVRYHSLRKHLLIVSFTFITILVLSLLFAVVLRKYGVMGGIHAGAWRGIYYHKNALGKWMTVSAIVFLLQSTGANKKRFFWLIALGLSIVALVLAKSSAALISLLGLVLIFSLLGVLRLQYELMASVITFIMLAVAIVTVWIINNGDLIFSLFGKDPSLTGRTDLWEFVTEIALRRPWLGYGYGAFWAANGGAEEVWRAFAWTPPNSHNGYIDTWLNIGLIGLFIFAVGFIKNLGISLLLIRKYGTPEVVLPFMLIAYLGISNYSESGLMLQNDFFWVIYVSLSYLLSTSVNNKYYRYSED